MNRHVLALAGGVGGAKLASGLCKVLDGSQISIVVNTADDTTVHGLYVCPDVDTVMYSIAKIANPCTGWGINCDTFDTLDMLAKYGADTWFNIGDRDMATHIIRSELLQNGYSLSDATAKMCKALGIDYTIVPMSDHPIRTVVETTEGDLSFQEYFVKRRWEPIVRGIHFENWKGDTITQETEVVPSLGFLSALDKSSVIIFCPSNPFLSINPMLALKGIYDLIYSFEGTRIAISPIVGGKAIRGPAAKLLNDLGHQVSCLGVARQYIGLCDIFVIDHIDSDYSSLIEQLGFKVLVTSILMLNEEDKINLARYICEMIGK